MDLEQLKFEGENWQTDKKKGPQTTWGNDLGWLTVL